MITVGGVVVGAIGAASVGLEREWSGHAAGPRARFGGIRTFTLLGGLGGLSGALLEAGWTSIATVLLAAASALVVAGYLAGSRKDVDATTEVAALVVLGAAVLSGMGQAVVAAGIFAATALLLFEKSRLHTLVRRVDDVTLRASLRFAALALVVLPALPSGAYGPFGAVRPRELWAFVLFFSGLSFAGWIARRLIGPTQGIVVAGLLGGLISSTSVTLTFARASRQSSGRLALSLGTVAACTVMLVRVAVASSILNWSVSGHFAPYAAAALAIGVLVIAIALRRKREDEGRRTAVDGSPLQLGAALQMAALFQVVMIGVSAVIAWWSVRALLATSALIGLTDLDALTLSLARRSSGVTPEMAGRALAVGVLSNTLLKCAVALVVGRGAYRLVTGVTLATMAATVALALWWF